jgi:DNA-binding MarR family transcriptional regulator
VASFPTHPSLEGFTGFLMRKISATTFERFSAATAEYGLHPMHFGMLTVLDADSPISQHDLSQRTGVDPSSMVARMDVLEELGLVERQRRPDDRRAYEIRLTDKGRTVLGELRGVAAQHMEQMLAPLGPAERKQLNELLRRISAGLSGGQPAS